MAKVLRHRFFEYHFSTFSYRGTPCWLLAELRLAMGFKGSVYVRDLMTHPNYSLSEDDCRELKGPEWQQFCAANGLSQRGGQSGIIFESGIRKVAAGRVKGGWKSRDFLSWFDREVLPEVYEHYTAPTDPKPAHKTLKEQFNEHVERANVAMYGPEWRGPSQVARAPFNPALSAAAAVRLEQQPAPAPVVQLPVLEISEQNEVKTVGELPVPASLVPPLPPLTQSPPPAEAAPQRGHSREKLSDEMVGELLAMARAGETNVLIAKHLGISESTVRQYCKRYGFTGTPPGATLGKTNDLAAGRRNRARAIEAVIAGLKGKITPALLVKLEVAKAEAEFNVDLSDIEELLKEVK
jgi:transposase